MIPRVKVAFYALICAIGFCSCGRPRNVDLMGTPSVEVAPPLMLVDSSQHAVMQEQYKNWKPQLLHVTLDSLKALARESLDSLKVVYRTSPMIYYSSLYEDSFDSYLYMLVAKRPPVRWNEHDSMQIAHMFEQREWLRYRESVSDSIEEHHFGGRELRIYLSGARGHLTEQRITELDSKSERWWLTRAHTASSD